MAKARQTRVVFLWHMHQPSYRSPLTGEYLLPWVLVHAMRDYYDMPLLASRVEGVTPTFNLVPGMVQQIEEYASGRANDVFLQTAMKDPADLVSQEKLFLLKNFFNVHQDTMLRPFRRYVELEQLSRYEGDPMDAVSRFSDGDWMDLQLWFFLAWTGITLRQDPRVSSLLEKGRGFTQGDKAQFAEAVSELLNRIIPLHRELQEQGSIEVACSPMYHPILPLLVDTNAAHEAAPEMRLPASVFSYPDDARMQVRRGVDLVSERMGRLVRGMWPSEGSVSTRVMEILSESGVEWIATDEKILKNTFGGYGGTRADAIFRPWKVGNTAIFFRDTQLSDLIGFVYSRWKPEVAVKHFLGELHRASRESGLDNPVITIAMDGENAWEYYIHGGMRFVELMYRALAEDDRFLVQSPSQVLKEVECGTLEGVCAGSWIDGTFYTWMGDPVKNRGWDHLLAARQAVEAFLTRNHIEPEAREELVDLVLRSEASDWFWWFGEGHTSPYDAEFDLLFRHHLKAIYGRLGMHPPEELERPLDPSIQYGVVLEPPMHLISPSITGKQDNYYKWLSAGRVTAQQGISHRPNLWIREVRFGFDKEKVYLKLESTSSLAALLKAEKLGLVLHVAKPTHLDFKISPQESGGVAIRRGGAGGGESRVEGALHSVLELAIPIACLSGIKGVSVKPDAWVELYFVMAKRGRELERFPHTDNIVFQLRGEELNAENWHV